MIEEALKSAFPNDRVLGYVFLDRGTFEKSLNFVDPERNQKWGYGETSSSIVYYGFVRAQKSLPIARCRSAMERLLEILGISKKDVFRFQIGESPTDVDGVQPSFNFPSA
jgi:hypothetical protein